MRFFLTVVFIFFFVFLFCCFSKLRIGFFFVVVVLFLRFRRVYLENDLLRIGSSPVLRSLRERGLNFDKIRI